MTEPKHQTNLTNLDPDIAQEISDLDAVRRSMTKPKPTIENPRRRHDDYGVELEAFLTHRARICPSVSVAYAMADPGAKAKIREALEAKTREAFTDAMAYLRALHGNGQPSGGDDARRDGSRFPEVEPDALATARARPGEARRINSRANAVGGA